MAGPTGLEVRDAPTRTDQNSQLMASTTGLYYQQFSRDIKRQVTTPSDLFTHPLVTQLVAHYRSAVVIDNKSVADFHPDFARVQVSAGGVRPG